jgi:hypothetical protein
MSYPELKEKQDCSFFNQFKKYPDEGAVKTPDSDSENPTEYICPSGKPAREKRTLSEDLLIPSQFGDIIKLIDSLPKSFSDIVKGFKMEVLSSDFANSFLNDCECSRFRVEMMFDEWCSVVCEGDHLDTLERKFVVALSKHKEFSKEFGHLLEVKDSIKLKKMKAETRTFRIFVEEDE